MAFRKCEICNNLSYGFKVEHTSSIEVICLKCGTPYIKKNRGKQRINIKNELVPHMKRYWSKEGKYMGLATQKMREHHKGSDKGKKEFVEWLNEKGVVLNEK